VPRDGHENDIHFDYQHYQNRRSRNNAARCRAPANQAPIQAACSSSSAHVLPLRSINSVNPSMAFASPRFSIERGERGKHREEAAGPNGTILIHRDGSEIHRSAARREGRRIGRSDSTRIPGRVAGNLPVRERFTISGIFRWHS